MDCVLKSFSYVTDIPEDTLVKCLGHNGREEVDPERPFPYNLRGFSIDEFAWVLLAFDFACTRVDKEFYRQSAYGGCLSVDRKNRVHPLLNRTRYCLFNATHMIGVRDGIVKDVGGNCTSPFDFEYKGIVVVSKIHVPRVQV